MLNINGNASDLYYRYKMPHLCLKEEGKGNGLKTLISNATEVSKSLNRPIPYIIKYMGYTLGTQTQCDFRNQRFSINGLHQSKDLQRIMTSFIDKYVLCSKCGNPETEFTIKKNKVLQTCKACGSHIILKEEKSKMNNFILKDLSRKERKDLLCSALPEGQVPL